MPYFYFDSTYFLVLIGAIICIAASTKVKSTFNKYSNSYCMANLTGAEVAERMLYAAGVYGVQVVRVSGQLTDHYNPKTRTLHLSDSVYGARSVAAVGVAAHECGHAIQHAQGYVPLKLRSAFVPVANIGSYLAWPLILIGVFINSRSSMTLIHAGIFLFSFALIFQLLTLPVEFNASNRAIKMLSQQGILVDDELIKTKRVLSAAAMTYVAGVAAAALQLLRVVILFGGRRRD